MSLGCLWLYGTCRHDNQRTDCLREVLYHIVVSNCHHVEYKQIAVVTVKTPVCVAVFVRSVSKPVKCFSVPQTDLTGKCTLVKTYHMPLADRSHFD